MALIWQSVGVDQSVIAKIELLRPAIKRDWGALLRAEPTLSPLGHPDTLTFLMDETINQVIKSVHSHTLKSMIQRSPVLLASWCGFGDRIHSRTRLTNWQDGPQCQTLILRRTCESLKSSTPSREKAR